MIMSTTSDVIIIGGGIIGMSIAIDLKLKGISVTVCNKNLAQSASPAAAGMLAPYAERLSGPLLDLCLKSRCAYPDWIRKIQKLTNLDLKYENCGALAPVYNISQNSRSQCSKGQWLDGKSIHLHQLGLGKDVKGGWLYPDDGVDSVRDGEDGARAKFLRDDFLHVFIRLGVDARRRLVETHHSRVPQHGAREAKHLPLAGGVVCTEFLHWSVET